MDLVTVCRLQKDEQPLRKRAEDGSSMSLTSLIHSLAILSSKMTVEPSRKMHELLYILVLMEMPGGMQNKYLSKFARSLRLEAAHPGKQALFIFGQSSAPCFTPPDALRPFEMNKSDRGKQ